METTVFYLGEDPVRVLGLRAALADSNFNFQGAIKDPSVIPPTQTPGILLTEFPLVGKYMAGKLSKVFGDWKVVIMNAQNITRHELRSAFWTNAWGVGLWSISPEDLVAGLDKIQQGEIWTALHTLPEVDPSKISLALRDRKIIELLKARMTNKEIAEEMGTTEATVKTNINRLFHRLGASNRFELSQIQLSYLVD